MNIADPQFRIEEIVVIQNVQRRVVPESIYFVTNIAILKISESINITGYSALKFRITVNVTFVCGQVIPFVMIRYASNFSPGNNSIMLPIIPVPGTTEREFIIGVFILKRNCLSIQPVIQPQLTNKFS